MPSHKCTGRAKTSRDRRVAVQLLRTRILIVCEGEETERNYFEALIQFHRLNVRIEFRVQGSSGRSGLSLMQYAETLRGTGSERFDIIWGVFDKDDLPDADFDNAIAKARGHKFLRAAWTNEAFELWYVLHFEYLNAAPAGKGGKARTHYTRRLDVLMRNHCGRNRYQKNDPDMYVLLGEKRRQSAVQNARRLLEKYDDATPCHARKPATTVHEMIETLLQYAPANR